jgi:transcriptional regulator with XRE-family HTH domain
MIIDGIKLKQLRDSKKLSRFQLSLACDVSPSAIEKIEKGERSGLCVAYKLAEYFKMPIEELIIKN